MIVIGIDPGLATVGIGLVETQAKGQLPHANCHLIDFCTIETSPTLPTSERLLEIASDLGSLLKQHQPDLAVVEKLYFETNRKTAMQVAEARGVILVTLAEASIPMLEPTPLQLKLAVTGDGQADKKQMRKMLTQILRVNDAAFAGAKDDAVDAVALAVFGALYPTSPPFGELPARLCLAGRQAAGGRGAGQGASAKVCHTAVFSHPKKGPKQSR